RSSRLLISAPKPMPERPTRVSMILSSPTKAPPQTKSTLEVSTWMNSWCGCLRPPWGGTLATVPSRILSSACCTPSPETSRVVDGDGEDLLGPLLPDHVLIEHGLDLGRLGEAPDLSALLLLPLLGDDVVAELDALVADVHGGPGDELAHIVLALAAERALQRAVAFARSTRHRCLPYFWTCAASACASLIARVVGLDEMASSTILFS